MSLRIHSKTAVIAVLIATITAVSPSPAGEQNYPSKLVRLVIPFSAGGPNDIAARIVADELGKALGQRFVADNRPGAGGNIAAELAAKSAPDGYTLFWAQAATHGINPSLYRDLRYDAVKDFAPVGLIAAWPMVLVANPSLGVTDIKGLIALAKSKPGKLNFASGGTGTLPHMAGELLATLADIRWTHVPYKGSAPALPDVIGGHVDLMFDGIPSVLPYIRSGKLKALGVATAARSNVLPSVPAIGESIPGFEVIGWTGLVAPTGTPREIIERLSAALTQIARSATLKERFEQLGISTRTATPEATAAHIRAEIDKWRKVVEMTGAKVE